MTLATHIVTGAAAARVFTTHPIQAFLIGWLSHYLLDSIIHWDYPLKSFEGDLYDASATKVHFNKSTFIDIAKVILDVVIGFLIVLLATDEFTQHNLLLVLAGAVGGGIPDFIQFLHGTFKTKPLEIMQKFHHFMHAKKDLNNRPVIGVAIQLCIVAILTVFI